MQPSRYCYLAYSTIVTYTKADLYKFFKYDLFDEIKRFYDTFHVSYLRYEYMKLYLRVIFVSHLIFQTQCLGIRELFSKAQRLHFLFYICYL